MLIRTTGRQGTGGGGATAFTQLTDVPNSYAGQAGKIVQVNPGASGLQFTTLRTMGFYVDDYGAQGNGQRIVDGVITGGTATLSSASGLFAPGDVKKSIVINGAGVSGGRLVTTITAYNSPTSITLAVNAGTSVTGAIVSWGTDDTTAIQNAINAAYNSGKGCGQVIFSIKNYYTGGVLTLYPNVQLNALLVGPYEPNYAYPLWGPCIWITNETSAFLSTNSNTSLLDLIFYYPNQVRYTASSPIVYPYTIATSPSSPNFNMRRCTLPNSYNGLDLKGGRYTIQDLYMGHLNIGINVDNSLDIIKIQNVHIVPFWETMELGGGFNNGALAQWVLATNTNAWSLIVGRADQLQIDNFFSFHTYGGILIQDSPDTTLNPRQSYGYGSNINLDFHQYPVQVFSTQPPGWKFTNLDAAMATGYNHPVMWLRTGGLAPPLVYWINGVNWNGGTPSQIDAGTLRNLNVSGLAQSA